MVDFIWQDHYLLGNEAIDQQHQELFDLANRLVHPKNKEALIENALYLYRHVREHFKDEEAFMKSINYPDFKQHSENHNAMLDELITLSNNINKNEWQQTDVLTFMQNWVAHIIRQDVGIKDFLQSAKN